MEEVNVGALSCAIFCSPSFRKFISVFFIFNKQVSQSCAERTSTGPKRGLASLAGYTQNAGSWTVSGSREDNLIKFYKIELIVTYYSSVKFQLCSLLF